VLLTKRVNLNLFTDKINLDARIRRRPEKDLGHVAVVEIRHLVIDLVAFELFEQPRQPSRAKGDVIEITLIFVLEAAFALRQVDERHVLCVEPVAETAESGPRPFREFEYLAEKPLFGLEQLSRRPDIDVIEFDTRLPGYLCAPV
jgi:hypothetical protein